MAAKKSNTKTSRSKKASGSKAKPAQNNKKNTVHNDKNKNPYRNEIVLLTTLVLSIIMILSFFHLTGIVGEFINIGTFGSFGILAYLFPFLLFIGMAFYLVNQNNKAVVIKIISVVGIFLLLEAFIHIFTGGTDQGQLLAYFSKKSNQDVNGGFVGACIGGFLYRFFGSIGAYVLIIAGIILLMMFITEKLFFSSLGKKSTKAYQSIKEKRRERRAYQGALIEENLHEEDMTMRPKKAATVTLTKEKVTKNKSQDTEIKQEEAVYTTEENSVPVFSYELPREEQHNEFPNLEQNEKVNLDHTEHPPLYRKILKEKFGRNKSKPFNEKESIEDAKEEFITTRIMQEEVEVINNQERLDIPLEHPVTEPFDEHIYEDNHVENNKTDYVKANIPLKKNRMDNKTNTKKPIKEFEEFEGTIGGSETEAFQQLEEHESIAPITDTPKSIEPKRENKKEENTFSELEKKLQTAEHQKTYVFPPINLLTKPNNQEKAMSQDELKEKAIKLQKTLDSFGVKVHIKNVSCGPTVTRFELQPEQGVKVSRITRLADDIKLNLAAEEIRIEAPIPGKAAVGIEVPNRVNTMVMLRNLMESPKFQKHDSNIAFAVGKDIGGQTVVTDIAKMPHLLIAGATGSGKSVCINTLIMSILFKAHPDDVKLIMIDPKVVELSVYNGIPHLLIPVVTDPQKASGALHWAVMEMTDRYNKFAELGVRGIKGYNDKVAAVADANDPRFQKMPQIVIIVDELADLMMVTPGEVEESICRLAQLARAAGIHLIIATQRPSVNVITGLIKANIPSRIAFSVASTIDSRTILDGGGAEKLLGKGDMLFYPAGYPKPVRVQGAFVSDKEVSQVVEFLKEENGSGNYDEEVAEQIVSAQAAQQSSISSNMKESKYDDHFTEVGKFIIEKDKASITMIQRAYKMGYNRAARLMEQLSDAGVVGPEEGTKPRKVIMSLDEFEQYVEDYV